MMPEIGQQVKCIFRNGACAEGIVEHWHLTARLRSVDGQSVLIITRPDDDIMMIKILLDQVEDSDEVPEETSKQIELPFTKGEPEKLESTQPVDPFNPEYNKSLVDLRKELALQEREIMANKLRAHRPTIGGVKVKYEQPGFSKKPSAE